MNSDHPRVSNCSCRLPLQTRGRLASSIQRTGATFGAAATAGGEAMSHKPTITRVTHNKETILVGNGLLDHAGEEIKKSLQNISRYVILSDTTVWQLHGRQLLQSLSRAGLRALVKLIPPGEMAKTRQTKEDIEDFMLKEACNRDTCLIAFGGGVVGDLGGFVAATFMRGIEYFQIPTTLLAMVDSSIGGKTGLDVPAGKNLIGAFHHPRAILIDPLLLNTLSQREFSNGMAEVIKIAAVRDASLFELVEGSSDKLLERHSELLAQVLLRSASLKAHITSADEREAGLRAVLNWGHTLGHAIEALLAPKLLHGECVAIGMVFEAKLALTCGQLHSSGFIGRLVRCLQAYSLPFQLPKGLTADALLEKLQVDKKNAGRQIRCVMVQGVGRSADKPIPVAEALWRALVAPQVAPAVWPKPVVGELAVPGSKSCSNRALLLAAMGAGTCRLQGLLHADDTHVMLDALHQLGVKFRWLADGDTLELVGAAGKFRKPAKPLFLGNAGTASRFLTTMCTLITDGNTTITGVARLKERPIKDLTDALRANHCQIRFLEKEGFFPFEITGTGLRGGTIELDAKVSSQFVSSILMSAPYAQQPVRLRVRDPVSLPYIEMTIQMMAHFGVLVKRVEPHVFEVPLGCYTNPKEYIIEGDASSASYPLAIAAITGGSVTVTNIGEHSLQGDAQFCKVLQQMGCEVEQTPTQTRVRGPSGANRLRGVDVDMSTMTDTFMTVCALAAVAEGRTRITNIANQRVKECNRIAVMVQQLRKCGVRTDELPDGIEVHGSQPENLHGAPIECYNDHRIAMSFAVLGCRIPEVIITDRECVEKTYPEFWLDLESRLQVPLKAYSGSSGPVQTPAAVTPSRDAGLRTESLVVVGMRGSGKTSMGRALATSLQWRFVDLDEELERAEGQPIKTFVASKGWPAFREAELRVLQRALQEHPHRTVFATGGGVVETPAAAELLVNYKGLVVQLSRHIEDIVAYLSADTSRPNLGAEAREIWAKRKSLYLRVASHEFRVPRGDHDWPRLEAEWCRFARRLLARAPPQLPPATSYFLSLTYESLAGVTSLLPQVISNVDAVELRVDLLHSLDADFVAEQLALLRSCCSLPVIFTVRSKDQGGKFEGSDEQMAALLALGLRHGCEFIDVEASLPLPLRQQLWNSARSNTRVISSLHNYSQKPTAELLRQLFDACARDSLADIVKVVGFANDLEDNFVLRHVAVQAAADYRVPVIALCAGDKGRLSRVLNRFLTPVTHPLLTLKAAPGQLSVTEIQSLRAQLALADGTASKL